MNPLLYPIVIPFIAGLLLYVIPRKVRGVHEAAALLVSAGTFGLTVRLFLQKPMEWITRDSLVFRLDDLSAFVLLAAGFFGFLIVLYSVVYMKDRNQRPLYYGSLMLTLGATCGALISNHLILLLIFWGFLGITLYLLIQSGGDGAAPAAKKSLIIIGGSDALLLLGIVFIYSLTNTFEMDKILLSFSNGLTTWIFILLALSAFAKAGSLPLHTWIPDMAVQTPIPATAFMPAALDKLLGIYLLGRMVLNLFHMNNAMNLFLMIVGAVTIITAVMMALIQHDLRKLLAYHAVSQVGYMVLGIGTGTVIGIAGGLFHMLNNTLYKTGLFLTGGSVRHRTGTADLDGLGGLARFMPMTFLSFLVAALAISGIPPLNGFVSKWMVYQGLVELGRGGDKLWVVWLLAAMFGSGLTLASFMKLTHSVFLGDSVERKGKKIREVGFTMWLPTIILAVLCVVFGVFAVQVPLKHLIVPAVGSEIEYIGSWSPGLATLMILIGLGIGFLIYLAGNLKGFREADSFIGGEELDSETRVTGTGFYNTIREMGVFSRIYRWAEDKWFDIYDLGNLLFSGIGGVLRKAHTGVLNLYVFWFVFGLIVLLIVLMGGSL